MTLQGALVSRTLNPFNWPKLVGGSYGRSELAADYYDETLFSGATFNDLLDKPTPMAVVTGTDLSPARASNSPKPTSTCCLQLGQGAPRTRRGKLVGSSPVLSPVTLNNYGGTCGFSHHAGIEGEVAKPEHRSQPAGRALDAPREQGARS